MESIFWRTDYGVRQFHILLRRKYREDRRRLRQSAAWSSANQGGTMDVDTAVQRLSDAAEEIAGRPLIRFELDYIHTTVQQVHDDAIDEYIEKNM